MLAQRFLTSKIFSTAQPYLVAVSGGLDSMALLALLKKKRYHLIAAHCNFKLRDEADADEKFVEEYCKENNIAFTSINFDTKSEMQAGESVQMTARRLRYKWFNKISREKNCAYVLTAHHLNDSLETSLLNFTKGTGIAGLTGIPFQNGQIVRPFIMDSRAEIEAYVKEHHIPYREDKSNAKTDYQRNAIRHNVLPALEQINPALISTYKKTEENLQYSHHLYRQQKEKNRGKYLKPTIHGYEINSKQLLAHPFPVQLLYDLIHSFEFNHSMVADMVTSMQHSEGKLFQSETTTLIKDRNKLVILERAIDSNKAVIIEKNDGSIELGEKTLTIQIKPIEAVEIKPDKRFAFLDADKLETTLLIRPWRTGDYFYPFGLNKKKKVARFLNDAKASILEKQQQSVLCNGNKIAWVVGRRIDHRFSITPKTKRVAALVFQ